MKKLISLLACAALLVGLVIAAFPAFSGVADTAITTPGFTGEAPGTTTYKLGGANGTNGASAQATLTVGEDKTYTYDLTQDLGYWVKNTVYAPDNQTPADVTAFKYLYVNVVDLVNGYCTNANGDYVNASKQVVATEKEAKYQQAFLAKLSLVDASGNRLKKNGQDWSIISDIRSKACVKIDLDDIRTDLENQGLDAAALLGNLKLEALVYGKQVKIELYASNNESFVPGELDSAKNSTVSLEMSTDDKGTAVKNSEGYFIVTGDSDNVALLNMFTTTGAGNANATTYPYLHMKFVMAAGAKINSAVLVDEEGNVYKKDGAEVNLLGGALEYGKQITFATADMTAEEKEQFLSNLRIKVAVEGSVSMMAKLSTKEDLKLSTDNVPGVTAFKLTVQPGSSMPSNATVEMDEITGSAKYSLTGHLAAWVPGDMYYAGKRINGNDYRYLVIDVKSMVDGLCMNDSNTSYAAEIPDPTPTNPNQKKWVDVETEEEAKLQTGFVASFQLSYKNAAGSNVQLKKVNLDSSGAVKKKTIREDATNFDTATYDKENPMTVEVTVNGEKVQMKSYYLLDENGKYMVDGGDWAVAGEARSPMTMAPVDFQKIAATIEENNAALDKALKEGVISQAERDSYYMNLEEVLENLTVRALIYGSEVQIDYYVTNNSSFVPGEITDESVLLGMSTSKDYAANSQTAEAAYDMWTDSNEITNDGSTTTLVSNLYALQGGGNMDARNYQYLYLRVNALDDGTKISSIKLMDMEGNIFDQNLLGSEAVAGQVVRVDMSQMADEMREQFLENTRLVIDMTGTRANIQAAFSQSDAYAFETWYDVNDPNYAYKLHLQPLHIEFSKDDVTFHSNGAVSVNLSANGAGMHVQDRYGALDATKYKYMYLYMESGTINDIRFRTSDNSGDADMKVEKMFSAGPGLTRIDLSKLHEEKPRLMKDLCFNFVVYVSSEITGIWFSNSPTFDPIATATEKDYEIVIGQEVAPYNMGATMVMNLDGSMEFDGKGEAHFKPITGTKNFNATKLKYLVVDIDSGAEHLKELRLRNQENNVVKSVSGLKNGLNYLVINQLDERILENLYFAMVVDGKVKISSMWVTNEPMLDPNYMATAPEYEEILLESASGYAALNDRISGDSDSVLTMGEDGMITVTGPTNKDVGLYTSCYHNPYSNPPEAVYIKFGVVNRPLYVVAYTYDTSSDEAEALLDVLTVNIEEGVYNDYVRIDLRDSSFYSKGFNGFLEFDIYAVAEENGSKSNSVAFTIADTMYLGTGSPVLSPVAKGSSLDFVPVDAAQYLNVAGYEWGDGWQFVTVDEYGNIIGAATGENSVVLPVAMVAILCAGTMLVMVIVRRKRKQHIG